MMELKKELSASDIKNIKLQDHQSGFLNGMSDEILRIMEGFSFNYCVFKNEMPVGAFGVVPVTDKRGMAWALLAGNLGCDMLFVYKNMKALLDNQKTFSRIEMTADSSFIPAVKFAEMLGFQKEGLLRKYGLDGSDHYMFARCYG